MKTFVSSKEVIVIPKKVFEIDKEYLLYELHIANTTQLMYVTSCSWRNVLFRSLSDVSIAETLINHFDIFNIYF